MNVVEFLASLANKDIRLWLEGDNLRFSAPEGAFTPELRDKVVANKPAIIEFLRQARKLNEVAIAPVSRQEPLITSFGQQRLWILDQLNPGDLTYNMSSALRIRGPLNVAVFDRVLRELVQRHESLRTTFVEQDGEPLQVIQPAGQWQLQQEDLSHLDATAQQALVAQRVNAESLTPYDLAQGPLFRARLLQLAQDHFVLVAGMHHIVSDAWSMDVLTRELGMLYLAFAAGMPAPLPALAIQYADYAAWQRQQMGSDEMQKHLDYWQQTLTGAPPVLALPTDRPRRDVPSNNGALKEVPLSAPLADKINQSCRALDLTPFMYFLGAWQLLLGRYANSQDVVVGSPIAGRSRTETQELIGFFVNLMLMRLDLSGNPSVTEFYQRVKTMALGGFSHQDLPIDRLLEVMAVERQPGYPPLAQAAFQLINLQDVQASSPLADAAVQIETIPASHVAARMDLLLAIAKTGDHYQASLEFNTDLFDDSTVSGMLEQYLFLLAALADAPQAAIDDIQLYDDTQLLQQLGCDPRNHSLLPLNPNQHSMVLDHLAHPDTIQNSYGIYVDLAAAADFDCLQQAIQQVVNSAPALRMRLQECTLPAAEDVYGIIPQQLTAKLELVNLDGPASAAAGKSLQERTLTLLHRTYDIFREPLLRYHLVQQQGQYRLVIACHHIVLDGASTYVLMERILQAYQQLLLQPNPAAAMTVEDCGAFAFQQWSRAQVDTAATLDYWRLQASQTEPLNYSFSNDYRQPGTESAFADRIETARLDHRQLATIREHCASQGINLPLYFKTLFGLMLQHYCHPEHGFRFAEFHGCRQQPWQDALGCFYQQFPTVVPGALLSASATLSDWYSALRSSRDSARAHRLFSLQAQHELLPSSRAVFMFNYYNFVSRPVVNGQALQPVMSAPKVNGGVQFIVKELGDGIELELRYDATVFNGFQFLPRALHLNEQILFEELERPAALQFLSAAEQMQLARHQQDLPLDQADDLVRCFETMAAQCPDNTAVITASGSLSYGQLNRQANQLAHHLIAAGVGPNVRVAVCLERSAELLVAIWGVLKAGGAYVPLDPSYPRERLAYMIEDADAPVVISLTAQAALAGLDDQHNLILLDRDAGLLAASADTNPGLSIDPAQQIYVIYTSGSTGKPKGAVVCHGGEINLQHWYLDMLAIGPTDRTLLVSAVGFDLTQKNLFAPLLVGAAIVMPAMDVYDEQLLLSLIAEHQVSWINCAPSAFYPIVESAAAQNYHGLTSLRYLVLGGEPIRLSSLSDWLSAANCQAQLVNSYGPTECTDVVSWHVLGRVDLQQESLQQGSAQPQSIQMNIPIGKPIVNTRLYLLNDNLQQVVPGCVGEICVAGAGVGLGYINRDELNAQVFVNIAVEPGKVYRTGDLGRVLPDGSIEYIGRRDFQIKLRGLRIELGEIEQALKSLAGVTDALVLVHDERLIAYVIAGTEPDGWRENLRAYLPDYMLPTVLVCLPQWPLTPNGKIDRKALPDPAAAVAAQKVYVAPRTTTERQLALIWQEVLQQTDIGVLDNLFDLGGNSLLATRIVSRIKKQFDIPLAVRELFVAPTIADLASAVERAGQTRHIPPITAFDDGAPSPLSFAQQRLWFLDQLQPGNTAYNLPGAFRLQGNLNVAALTQALQIIVARHEVLRSSVQLVDDEPVQVVVQADDWSVQVVELSQQSIEQQQRSVTQAVTELYQHQFDLSAGPLFYVKLLVLADNQHVLLINMHHIVTDGWSNGILMRELGMLYDALSHGRLSPLPELKVQYRDFARWQRQWLTGAELERQISYWRDALTGVEVLGLPTDYRRTAETNFAGNVLSFQLNRELTASLNHLCRQQGVSLYMVTVAAYMVLLSRYSGQDDIAVGSPIANRNFEEIEPVIGFFVNTLVVRGELDARASFLTLLEQVRRKTLDAYAHQDVPFERLVDELVSERDMLHSPLFQVLFSVQNMAMQQDIAIPGLKLESISNNNVVAKFDLEFSLLERDGQVLGEVVYRTALFEQPFIDGLINHYIKILQQVVAAPEQALQDLTLVSPAELRQLQRWNDTGRDYQRNITIHQLIEQQVDRTPDAIALMQGDTAIRYLELEQRANQLARYLMQQGVACGDTVAVLLPRSVELMVSLLAVMKCGATYLPLDPAYPAERIQYMLEDAGASVLLMAPGLTAVGADLPGCKALVLADIAVDVAALDSARVATLGDAGTMLYVIYTSGSTGRPKGTGASHRAEANLLHWYCREFQMAASDRVLLLSAIGFDLTQKNLFAPLVSGAALVLPGSQDYDPQALLQDMTRHQVTWINCAPNAFYPMLEEDSSFADLASLRWVFLGGEPIDIDRVQDWVKQGSGRLVNSYGPTECADIATFHVMQDLDRYRHGSLPIGHAIDNVSLYILDQSQQPVPIGVPGELCIGGEGVGPGYFNNPEQTAEKFIANPLGNDGSRIYRTGDLARFLRNGEVEYLGRIDTQVKIRGFRIEPGEIESLLRQLDGISASCVIAREDVVGQKVLVAYVVTTQQRDQASYRQYLRASLPEFMVPAAVVEIDSMPLTPNGKVARNQLPQPDYAAAEDRVLVAPVTDTEQKVLAIWQGVLQRESLSVTDDFFAVGGQSLLATQVMSRVRREFAVNIPLRALFEAPTIRNVALQIDLALQQQIHSLPPVTVLDRNGQLPLSFVQQQLWLLDQLDPGTPAYNMPVALRIRGNLDVALFERCFNTLIQRHETLRSNFVSQNGTPVVVIQPQRVLSLPVTDLTGLAPLARETELQQLAREQMDCGFDLQQDALLRGQLVLLAGATGNASAEYAFVGAIHHIVSDGWSLNVMTAELMELYQAQLDGRTPQLSELTIQYVDIAAWQRNWLSGDNLQQHLQYWRQQLDNDGQVLQLQTDYRRPAVMTSNGARVTARVTTAVLQQVNDLAREEGATLFMVLAATYQLLLHKYSGQEHINIGTPIAGRESMEMEQLVGFFINTVVLSTRLQPDLSLRELLRLVRETTLGAYAHQTLPFEKLVEELRPPRDSSRTPFFQAFLNLLNLPPQAAGDAPLQIEPLLHEDNHSHAKYDFNLYVSETGAGTDAAELELVLVYNTDLYRADTAQRLLDDFTRLLGALDSNSDRTIAEISLLQGQQIAWMPDLRQPLATVASSGPVELFLQQASAYPEAIAIEGQGHTLTYGELEQRSRSLAAALQDRGLGADDIVSVLALRSADLVVALLGTLRAGAAFNILDAGYPVERLQQILAQAGSKLILDICGQEALSNSLQQSSGLPCVSLSVLATDGEQRSFTECHNPQNLACVAFTSGSTGMPKGIASDFAPVAHFIQWYSNHYNITRQDCVSMLSGLAHDPLLRDIFVPLATGARIAIPAADWMLNPDALCDWLQQSKVTILHCTPAMARLLVDTAGEGVQLPSLRLAGLGGDRLPASLVRELRELMPGACLSAFYGATETPQVMAAYDIQAHADLLPEYMPIGVGIDQVQLLVLDGQGQLCAPGQTGEIVIRTPYLSRGYINPDQVTASGFAVNPLSRDGQDRLYHTGDRGRYRIDGLVEFLGRNDNQIKIRGFRVEPEEVEVAINQLLGADARSVVVAAQDPRGDDCLVAYVVSTVNDMATVLRNGLRGRLPEYMVPALFVALESIPLNRNGKVDRRKLPDPATLWVTREYVAPRNEFETRIAEIWESVLKVERISVVDNFFDVGGHSLLAVQIVSRVKEEYSIEFSMRRLLEIATIAGMASYVENALWVRESMKPADNTDDNTDDNAAEHLPASDADDDDFEELEI